MANSSDDVLKVLKETFVPQCILGPPDKPKLSESGALDAFRQRIVMQQAATGSDQPLRAPGFDYVRWKQRGQNRMHHNPEEYVRTCQGLAPFVGAISATAYEGMDERRWAGLTTVPPEIQGLQPKSNVGSRSNFGSREMLASR